MMRTGLLAAAVIAGLAGQAQAGPDATTNWFMDNPVSMMDFGLYRIEQRLQTGSGSMPPVGGNANFDWDRNRIEISSIYFHDVTDPEALCADWLQKVRRSAWVGEDGKSLYSEISGFAAAFKHNGFQRTSMPKDALVSLDKLIELECQHGVGDNATILRAPLLGTSYSVQKPKSQSKAP